MTDKKNQEVQEVQQDFTSEGIETSIDVTTKKGKMRAFSCMSSPGIRNDELKLTPFYIENYFCHNIEMTDEKTGDVISAKRTVLINPEGQTTAFVSSGAYTALQNLIDLFGPGPWKPAIPVLAKEVKTRKNFKTINLVICEDLFQE